jgi:hypothetical protein
MTDDDDDDVAIRYRFDLAAGNRVEIALAFDRRSFTLRLAPAESEAEWTRLGVNQCRHCPLSAAQDPFCPFARALSRFIPRFDAHVSYESAAVEVITERRTVVAHGALQEGMSSLVGLVGATCGCPHLAYFRPMAHFHLPFASERETLFRVFSIHLLEQFMRGADPPSLAGLRERYEAASLVNRGMADRIRGAFAKDSIVNAFIILDTFAQAAPYVIDGRLEELRHIFDRQADGTGPLGRPDTA